MDVSVSCRPGPEIPGATGALAPVGRNPSLRPRPSSLRVVVVIGRDQTGHALLRGLLRSPGVEVPLILRRARRSSRRAGVREALGYLLNPALRRVPAALALVSRSQVSVLAASSGIQEIGVESINDCKTVSLLRACRPDLIMLAGLGEILKGEVLSLPPLGIVNFHLSLLPRYRGTDPVEAAILHHDRVTGSTAHFVNQGIDQGDIIFQAADPIDPRDTSLTLRRKLTARVEELAFEVARRFVTGSVPRRPQVEAEASYFNFTKMVTRKGGLWIDWTASTRSIDALVRACAAGTEKPTTSLFGRPVEIREGVPEEAAVFLGRGAPGEVRFLGRTASAPFLVATGDGWFLVESYRFRGTTRLGDALYKGLWLSYKLDGARSGRRPGVVLAGSC